ncbi:MAG TPA: hypothetical protein VMQ86_03110 [Bryobacteraceae bacterium]|jgi:hypothetical protein|nr:hypothetical protein [Bryobacteraceae bacterium]
MSRRGLEVLAVILSFLIVIVLFAGFDNLPRRVRADIAAEAQQLPKTQTQFQLAQDEVTHDLSSDPDLFRAHDMNAAFPERFRIAAGELQGAQRDAAALGNLLKANRRQDQPQAEKLLKEERALRAAALNEATSVQTEAQRWVDMKRNLPTELQQMEADHQALEHWDFAPIAAVVVRAETDWPQKKSDLDARLTALRTIPADGEKTWQSSDAARRKAEAKDLAGLDYAGLLSSAETLHTDVTTLPARTQELQSLSGQLYTSWDKILVDLRDRKSGGVRDYEEDIRTVKTKFPDAAGKDGVTSQEEAWVEIPRATYQVAENNIGMSIAHKPVGKYDTEVDEVAEPAGFAYMAPVGERNQYGYWDHSSGGNFWVFYGQYALMRDLLWGHSYRPIPSYEWESYRTARSSGQTYYGRDEAAGAPKYGTHGTFTQQSYSSSRYVRSAGGYGNSKYATGGFKSGQSSAGHTFGSGSKPPSSGFKPRSAPSFRPSFRPPSGGRSFGRRH